MKNNQIANISIYHWYDNKLSKHHILATDSYYTSVKLCQLKFSFVGSIKKNRLTLAKEEAYSAITKGTYVFYKKENLTKTNVVVCLFKCLCCPRLFWVICTCILYIHCSYIPVPIRRAYQHHWASYTNTLTYCKCCTVIQNI